MSTFPSLHIPEFIATTHPVSQDASTCFTERWAHSIPLIGGLTRNDFLNLLNNVAGGNRNQLPAHFTTSCVIFNPSFTKVLLVHHLKYDAWVTPGGHADDDWFWLRSALRECFEETGLTHVDVIPAFAQVNDPHFIQSFDIAPFGNMPAHKHFDAVYIFKTLSDDVALTFDPSESKGISWFETSIFKSDAAEQQSFEETKLRILTAEKAVHRLVDNLTR